MDSEQYVIIVLGLAIVALIGVIISKPFKCFTGFKKKNGATEQDIRTMVEDSGTIDQSEREMIENIFEFNDRTVGEIMTPRTDLIAIEKNTSIDEIMSMVIEEGFSRIPVYDGTVDTIIGVLNVKDLLCLVGKDLKDNFDIYTFLREAIFTHESSNCFKVFRKLKECKLHLAVVVDEYGGTAGIVTMENLIEAIMGNIQDEYDDEDELVKRLSDKLYILDGSLNISAVERLFNIDMQVSESETLGGYIANSLGRIPTQSENAIVSFADITFKVMMVDERRITKVRAEHIDIPLE